ncbi:hypothetical protein TNCV_4611641 [Trichonephila clavipes]|nr:hypothetical protein TNCV_4611641 [Trichonephila clavipes]
MVSMGWLMRCMSPGRWNTGLTTPKHAEYQITQFDLGEYYTTHQAMPSEVPVDRLAPGTKNNSSPKRARAILHHRDSVAFNGVFLVVTSTLALTILKVWRESDCKPNSDLRRKTSHKTTVMAFPQCMLSTSG